MEVSLVEKKVLLLGETLVGMKVILLVDCSGFLMATMMVASGLSKVAKLVFRKVSPLADEKV
jgi:hypothetical protein